MVGQQGRNLSIETLRGVAILLVVAGHVIGSRSNGGMTVEPDSLWRYIYTWIDYIQMPLFTAIAGWVYAIKPNLDAPSKFILLKAKRLLIPMATVGTLYFLVRYITPGTNSKDSLDTLWHIYLYPYNIYWYLKSLFLIFIVVYVADRYVLMATVKGWWGVLLASWALYVAQCTVIPYELPNFFSFKGTLLLLPYFILGIGVKRFGEAIYPKSYRPLYYVLTVVGLILLQVKWFCPGLNVPIYESLLPLWVSAALLVIMNMRLSSSLLVYLGTYSYSIYLYHVFVIGGGRIILHGMGVYNQITVFIFATLLAIFVPIVVDKVLSRWMLARMLLLGKK